MEKASSAGRMERKREKTKQDIISAALALFECDGIEDTTMEQIAREVDIAKGTLYHYYPSKEAIIAAYLQKVSVEKNEARVKRLYELPDTRARMVSGMEELLQGVAQQKDLFERYFVYRIQQMLSLHRTGSREEGLELLETEIIRLGQKSGDIRDDLPFEILQGLFEFTFIVLVQRFYQSDGQFDAAAIEQCVELFMEGAQRR